jgi:two-component system, cell cycle response regulator
MDGTGTALRRFARLTQGVALALLIAFFVHATFWRDDSLSGFFNDWVYNALVLVAAASALTRAVRVRRDRAAWLLIGGALAFWAAAEITSTVYIADQANPPYPSISDAMWLVFYPASYLALILLVRGNARGRLRAGVWIDGLVAALTVGAFADKLLFHSLMQTGEGSVLQAATDLAYPLGDLVLLSLVVGVFAMTGWRPGRAWLLIGAGLVVASVSDALYVFQVTNTGYREGGPLDGLWLVATLLLGYAAWAPAGRRIEPRPSGLRVLVVPVLFGASALGLLVVDHFSPIDDVAMVLATLTLMTVLLRWSLTFRENLRMLQYSRREALTDSLTGLGNRRRLMTDLVRELEEATDSNPRALVMFDLDGFKRYNDNYGHPAGDALLARLGHSLALTVSPYGRAYRLGGDEFCALLEAGPDEASDHLERAHAALTEHGEGFMVSASHGIVFLPAEAADPSSAMQIADQRLYGNKDTRREQVLNEQTRDVLLQVLAERRPDLHDHLHDVADLALAVGRRMALLPEDLDEMARAAELHDVGKMAVPDEILNKPGPLDRVEMGFIRQHTIVGERILSAAPSLSPVAEIVRASHERWDGSGYPDGLKGEEIPLAARIVAACDAYYAMTSDRPYQAAVEHGAALAELRRCAGTHFDPAVVAVVCHEVEIRRGALDAPEPTPFDPTLDADMARQLEEHS